MRKPSRKMIGAIVILGLAGAALMVALFPAFVWWPGGTGGHLVLSGTVEATTIPVAAEVAGRVVEIPVAEGESVAPGTVLAHLDAAYAEAQVRQAEAAYLAAQARLDEAEAGTRGQQIRQAQAGVEQGRAREGQAAAVVEQVRASLDGARKHLAYQEKNLADQQKLFAAGVVPAKNVTDATALVDDARAKVQTLEAQLTAANGELSGAAAATKAAQAQLGLLVEGASSQAIRQLAAQVSQAGSVVEAARIQLDRCTVKALAGGTVQRVHVELGQVVNPGAPLLHLLDRNDLWVRVFIPEAALDRATLGQEVGITADAYPGRQFSGVVVQINDQGEFTPKNIQTPDERTRLVFAVKVKVTEGAGELKPGLPVDVDFGPRPEGA